MTVIRSSAIAAVLALSALPVSAAGIGGFDLPRLSFPAPTSEVTRACADAPVATTATCAPTRG